MYSCNRKVVPNLKKLTTVKKKVDCVNCLKYIKKQEREFKIKPKIRGKIHFVRKSGWNDNKVYLCNGACGTTSNKSTTVKKKVTCKNCLIKLNKWVKI